MSSKGNDIVERAATLRPDPGDDTYYRGIHWIQMPLPPGPPKLAQGVEAAERARLETIIEDCRTAASDLAARAARQPLRTAEEIDGGAVEDVWRKFLFAHFAFFFDFAFLAEVYGRAFEALEVRDFVRIDIHSDQICHLWRAAGALIRYGVDFTPTEELYKVYIRPAMPEGLSGSWLREYQQLRLRKKAWRSATLRCTGPDAPRVQQAGARVVEAEKDYHKLHFQVMQACVPELTSMLQAYESEHGPLEIEEGHYALYDRWFHVERIEDASYETFVTEGCRALRDVLDDIERGTGLEVGVLGFIEQGVSTLLSLMSEGLGAPVPAALSQLTESST